MQIQTQDQIKKSLDAAREAVRRAKEALQKSQAMQSNLTARLAVAERDYARAGDQFVQDVNEIVHQLDEDTIQFVAETADTTS